MQPEHPVFLFASAANPNETIIGQNASHQRLHSYLSEVFSTSSLFLAHFSPSCLSRSLDSVTGCNFQRLTCKASPFHLSSPKEGFPSKSQSWDTRSTHQVPASMGSNERVVSLYNHVTFSKCDPLIVLYLITQDCIRSM